MACETMGDQLTGRATDSEVPSRAAISVSTHNVKMTRMPLRPKANFSSLSSTVNVDDGLLPAERSGPGFSETCEDNLDAIKFIHGAL